MQNSLQIPLSELLRARRKLSPQEVVALFDQFAEVVSTDSVRIMLDSLAVEFDAVNTDISLTKLAVNDIEQWPPFRIRIVKPEATEIDFDQTLKRHSPAVAQQSPLSQFATVVYELLGGRLADRHTRLSPLPALNEEANRLLFNAIQPGGTDCLRFWRNWKTACGLASPIETWRVPRWVPHCNCEYDSIELTSENPDIISVLLVARPHFRIGRSSSLSDFPAQFIGGPEAPDSSARISRIHITANISGAGVTLLDGDGHRPTLNGSSFNGQSLSSTTPQPVTAGGLLRLGGCYDLELILDQEPAAARSWRIENLGQICLDSTVARVSCVRFRPTRSAAVRDAVWLFTAVGFTLDSSGRLAWSNHDSDGYFVRANGRFWIANARLEASRLRVDDAGVLRQQIIPLSEGRILDLDEHRYTVGVESVAENA